MTVKVYVGNLPFGLADAEFQELFAPFGEISEALIIKNKFSGRSKGFGFVTFKEEASAQKAIAEMNGKEVQGRPLVVNEAKPMEPRSENRERHRRNFRRRY
jgi:RNA recognition motif-containing protein